MANELDKMDISKVAADLSKDIFGGGEASPLSEGTSEGGDIAVSPSDSAPASDTSPSPGATPPPNLTPAQIKALPKSWKKDMEAHWAKLDPQIHDYVYEREADVMRGIQMYKEGADRWGNLVKPFETVLKENPNVDPIQLLQAMMHNHLAIVRGTPEQKKVLAQNLLKSYGIDLGQSPPPQGGETALQQEVAALKQEVSQLRSGMTDSQKRQFDAEVAQHKTKIEAFAADPKNKYFPELGQDILQLLNTGSADSLESAYEKACWLNPGVRAKMIAEQQSPPPAGEGKAASKSPTNINGSGEGTPSRKKPATMDDTINSVVQKHFPTH